MRWDVLTLLILLAMLNGLAVLLLLAGDRLPLRWERIVREWRARTERDLAPPAPPTPSPLARSEQRLAESLGRWRKKSTGEGLPAPAETCRDRDASGTFARMA